MIARAGSAWQTVLADLSLILFMVTASAVSQAPSEAKTPAGRFAMADPVAVWRPTAGGPPLARWLADQPADARLRLTLVAHAPTHDEAAALATALAAAGEAGAAARVVIDRDPGPPLEAILAYDRPPQVSRRDPS